MLPKYTKEFLSPIVASSTNYTECLRKAGRSPTGGKSVAALKNAIEKFEIDTSHFTWGNARRVPDSLPSIVASSASYSECLRKLGLKLYGGNFRYIQRLISRRGLDSSHMRYEATNKDREVKPFEGLVSKSGIKARFLKGRDYICDHCGISEWRGIKLVLELDHINGDNCDNRRENLRLLCPNCHSQTPTWRSKNRKKLDGPDSQFRTDTSCDTNS